jgi:hypothetical protein
VISRPELFVLLNIAWTDDELLDRIDSLANLVSDGLLMVHSDGDCVTSLSPTAEGWARMQPVLPWSTA